MRMASKSRFLSGARIDPLPDGHSALGYNCLGYRWATDPAPGTDAWTDRDRENQYCSTPRRLASMSIQIVNAPMSATSSG